jgi:AcrR family transcriptional regulator
MHVSEVKAENHRIRVGAERRKKMRRHLIEHAMVLFSQRGFDDVVIDDVIAAAAVSRGTFYNYFRTNAELISAVTEELGNEMMDVVESAVETIADPANRMAQGLRLYLHASKTYPVFGTFIARSGLSALLPTNLVLEYIPKHLQDGIDSGQFKIADVALGIDIVTGMSLASMFSMSFREVSPDYPEQTTVHILMALGLTMAASMKMVSKPLGKFVAPRDSLLIKTKELSSKAAKAP